RLSQREKRNDGVFDLPADAVAVPGYAVLAVPVEVEARRVEHDAIARRQRQAHAVEDLRTQRDAGAQVPRRGQARLADAMIEHAPGPLSPVAGLEHLPEHRIRAAHPSRGQVNPALGIEPGSDDTAEVRVEPGLAAVEGEEGLHARSSLTPLSVPRLRGCVARLGRRRRLVLTQGEVR